MFAAGNSDRRWSKKAVLAIRQYRNTSPFLPGAAGPQPRIEEMSYR